MTASRRMAKTILRRGAALLMLASASPLIAQRGDTPVDVTAVPPPSAQTVGPAELRNFSLNGTVTRPADPPAKAQPQQNATTQPARPSESSPRASDAPAARSGLARPSAALQPSRTTAPSGGSAESIALPVPTPNTGLVDNSTPSIAQPAFDVGDQVASTPLPAAPSNGFTGWPWIAALIAVIGGAAYLLRDRRLRRKRYGDFGRLAFAGPQTEGQVDRPRPDPIPPANHPIPPRSAPVTGPIPAPPAAAPPDGLVTSTLLRPQLNVQFTPDRAVVTEHEVMLQFDVVLHNSGSAPARDVLVEATLVSAHAGQDADIAGFFQQPAGSGDRIAAIAPLGRVSLKSAVRLPIAQIHDFQVEGRRLFVPMVAFNIHHRSGAAEAQASASFLIGRGGDEDEKLAPFRLDLGPRIFRGLSARPHSMGLQR